MASSPNSCRRQLSNSTAPLRFRWPLVPLLDWNWWMHWLASRRCAAIIFYLAFAAICSSSSAALPKPASNLSARHRLPATSVSATCCSTAPAPAQQLTNIMCRNIRPLFNFDPPVTDEEIRAASLQFVRKISGFTKPSKANEGPFLAAIDEIAGVSRRLINALETNAPPKNREEEAAKGRAGSAERYGTCRYLL